MVKILCFIPDSEIFQQIFYCDVAITKTILLYIFQVIFSLERNHPTKWIESSFDHVTFDYFFFATSQTPDT